MRAQHKPGSLRCTACEGACLRPATVDEANTALAVAGTLEERIYAAEALQEAAQILADSLRHINARRSAGTASTTDLITGLSK